MAMLEVKDLHVYYGVIQALKVFFQQKKVPLFLKEKILPGFRPIRLLKWELHMFRRDVVFFQI